jgi:hypothetical protein
MWARLQIFLVEASRRAMTYRVIEIGPDPFHCSGKRSILMEIPGTFPKECLYGFDTSDDAVGPGECRALAIELKHLYEGIAADADEQNAEIVPTKALSSVATGWKARVEAA